MISQSIENATTSGEMTWDMQANTTSEIDMEFLGGITLPTTGICDYSHQNPNDFKRKQSGKFDMKSIRKAHNKKHKK